MTTAAEAMPFRSEYEQELESWLRRRFGYLCMAYWVWGLLQFLIELIRLIASAISEEAGAAEILASLIGMTAYGGSFVAVGYFLFTRRPTLETRAQLLEAASQMILILGSISIGTRIILRLIDPSLESSGLLDLAFWHLSASLFLPWSPRESVRPMVPLAIVWALSVLILDSRDGFIAAMLLIIFGPALFLPGLGLCGWRLERHTRRFRTTMIGRRFAALRQEFTRARKIHESLFPEPANDGFVRFEYRYAPMRELGGDFVHLQSRPGGPVTMTIVDVTGHGLPATLTVNRLFGELERIHAESPHIEPGDVLVLLNRYINLTMAKHTIFATAACAMVDPARACMVWASAGHPPAFLRRAGGAVETLASTTALLGALEPTLFAAEQRSIRMDAGDVLVVFTDGAFEVCDRQGEALGLARLRELMDADPPPESWPEFLASEVDHHKAGRSQDDVLVASLELRALREGAAPTAAEPVADRHACDTEPSSAE